MGSVPTQRTARCIFSILFFECGKSSFLLGGPLHGIYGGIQDVFIFFLFLFSSLFLFRQISSDSALVKVTSEKTHTGDAENSPRKAIKEDEWGC